MHHSFKNRIAIVTGAASGIGRAIALGLANEDASVYMVDTDVDALESISRDVKLQSGLLIPRTIDLLKDDDIGDYCGYLKGKFDTIDFLIHSAGVITLGEIQAISTDDFDRQIKVNVRAPFLLTQGLLPLIRKPGGQIVFINSSAGLRAGARSSAYSASKHALKAFADSLRDEVNDDGIRVISVYPGRTATPMQRRIFETEGRDYIPDKLLQANDVADIVIAAMKLPKTAEVTDLNIRSTQKWG